MLGATPLHGRQVVEDPLNVFAKLMPVLSHDRCVNCHGATDAFKGFYHPGAVSRRTPCLSCHTASGRWDIAPAPMAFFQRSVRELCSHLANNLAVGEATAFHLEHDELIGLAFAGRRGNAVTAQYTEKPPMTRAEFVRAYRTWVQQTGGGCSAWEGTITRTEVIAEDTTGPGLPDVRVMGPMTVTFWQRGTHSYTITIKDGQATVKAILDGERNNKEVMKAPNCESTGHVRDAYSLLSTTVSGAKAEPGPADTTALAAIGDGAVRVGLAADGSYRIHVVPPAEKTQRTSTTTFKATCPIPDPSPSAHTETFDWNPWVFDITGKLQDPHMRGHLQGQTVEVMANSVDKPIGLAGSAAVGHLDGSSVKFRVTTTWDLKRAP